MPSRHVRTRRTTTTRSRRARLLVIVLAPLVVLAPLTALATGHTVTSSPTKHAAATHKAAAKAAAAPAVATKRLVFARSWSPALALLSDYRRCCSSKAGFLALAHTFDAKGSQKAVVTARFRTRWVDVKALIDGPNIAQQGKYADKAQLKLQIGHGSSPSSHRAQCRIKGATGSVLAFGPAIDVADGRWHTVTCVKSADGAHGTTVTVIVDAVAGKPKTSHTAIGTIHASGPIRLGGRSAVASSDSLDGWISSLQFWLVG